MPDTNKRGAKKRAKPLFIDLSSSNNSAPKSNPEIKTVNATMPNNTTPVETETTNVDVERDFAPTNTGAPKVKASTYNPLTEAGVDDKEYALGVETENTTEPEIAEEFPEQEFVVPPKVDGSQKEPSIQDAAFEDVRETQGGEGGGNDEPSGTSDDRYSSEPHDIPDKEMKQGVKLFAEWALRIYQKYVPQAYTKFGQISPKKANRMEREGQINLDIPLQYKTGETVSAGEEIQRRNSAIENVFDVSEEWIEDVRKPLERVLMKNNVKLSDEGYIGLKVAEHNLACINELAKIHADNVSFMDLIKERTMQMKQRWNTPPPAAQPQEPIITPPPQGQQTPPPPQEAETVSEPEVVITPQPYQQQDAEQSQTMSEQVQVAQEIQSTHDEGDLHV